MKSFFAIFAAAWVTAAAAADAPATFKVSEFTFTRPANWESVQVSSPLRKAQLKVTDSADKKKSAEVVFFHFGPGDGGGVQANVERWFRQFEGSRDQIGAKTDETKIGQHKVTFVRAEGTYLSGMPGAPPTPLPGYALRGAIVESDAEGHVFIKMTGPAALVKSAEQDFRKMIESAPK